VLIFRYSSEKYRTLEQERLLRSVDASKNYIAQLKESTAQLSQTRHELKNHVFYLEELIRQGKKAELLGYLENLKVQYAETEGIIYTGNRLIDAILNQKQAFAESLGIPTSFSTQVPEDIQFNDLTLCSVLGNLIDNAIEASVNEKRPAITADLHLYKDYLIITVENDVSYNVLEKNPQLHTTKKDADRHGIGIHAVQELLEKEGGIFLTEMADEHTFRVSAMLPCSVKLPGKEN
jgi:sensor histidine kinase regulating citrate/malate metabolism